MKKENMKKKRINGKMQEKASLTKWPLERVVRLQWNQEVGVEAGAQGVEGEWCLQKLKQVQRPWDGNELSALALWDGQGSRENEQGEGWREIMLSKYLEIKSCIVSLLSFILCTTKSH